MIDIQHHFLPPRYIKEASEAIAEITQPALAARALAWTPARSIEEMDRSGVAAAVLSLAPPGVWLGEAPAAQRLARACSEFAAGMVRAYPARFGFFAPVPMPDVDGTLKEMEYALDVLKADGIGLLTSYDGQWLGDAAFVPVFDELNRRRALVFVHPMVPRMLSNILPDVKPVVIEFLFDTTRTITSLLFSGTFSRCPDIRFIFAHAGGATPMLAERITRQMSVNETVAARAPKGGMYELRRLYFDITTSASAPQLAALLSLVPPSQVLFGSDFPYWPTEVTLSALGRFGLSAGDLQAIERGTALELLPRFVTA